MSEGIQFLDWLILIGIAVFFISRLRSVLGKTIDDSSAPKKRTQASKEEKVIHLHGQKQKEAEKEDEALLLADIGDPDVSKGIMAIKSADRNFNVNAFVTGAKMAFEMVLEAFAKGDVKTLESMLAKDVCADFKEAIEARETADEKEEATLVSIESANITAASCKGKEAKVTVEFVSEQIIITRDKDGKIADGDSSEPERVTDEWTFSRMVNASDPNWTLVDT